MRSPRNEPPALSAKADSISYRKQFRKASQPPKREEPRVTP